MASGQLQTQFQRIKNVKTGNKYFNEQEMVIRNISASLFATGSILGIST